MYFHKFISCIVTHQFSPVPLGVYLNLWSLRFCFSAENMIISTSLVVFKIIADFQLRNYCMLIYFTAKYLKIFSYFMFFSLEIFVSFFT